MTLTALGLVAMLAMPHHALRVDDPGCYYWNGQEWTDGGGSYTTSEPDDSQKCGADDWDAEDDGTYSTDPHPEADTPADAYDDDD